jgi:hypothetical protein
MATFYISSTYEDLKDHRSDVCKILRRRGHTVISMEDMNPTGRRPLEQCLDDVKSCDVYIGIIAWRYGFIPDTDNPDGQSITEREYRHARDLKPQDNCLLFLLSDAASWPQNLVEQGDAAARLTNFREHLQNSHTVSFFKSRRELRRKVKKAIRKFSHTRSLWEWLKDLLPDWPWYATASAALAAALALASLGLALYYWRMSPAERAEVKIKYGFWPARFDGSAEDFFDLPRGVNTDAAQCNPPTGQWDYTAGQWCVVPDKYTRRRGSGSLLIRGQEWGVMKGLEGAAIYDFEMGFRVMFEKGNEAAWVVHAQNDRRRGYVFKLQRERGEGDTVRVFLEGRAVTGEESPVPLGNTPTNPIQMAPLYESDFFDITVSSAQNVVSHVITVQNAPGVGAERPFLGHPFPLPDFVDKKRTFPYGNVGFFAPETGGEIVIDNFILKQPESPASPAP